MKIGFNLAFYPLTQYTAAETAARCGSRNQIFRYPGGEMISKYKFNGPEFAAFGALCRETAADMIVVIDRLNDLKGDDFSKETNADLIINTILNARRPPYIEIGNEIYSKPEIGTGKPLNILTDQRRAAILETFKKYYYSEYLKYNSNILLWSYAPDVNKIYKYWNDLILSPNFAFIKNVSSHVYFNPGVVGDKLKRAIDKRLRRALLAGKSVHVTESNTYFGYYGADPRGYSGTLEHYNQVDQAIRIFESFGVASVCLHKLGAPAGKGKVNPYNL